MGCPSGPRCAITDSRGGGPTNPIGQRAALVDHPGHTLGTDAVFAAFASAARAHPGGGSLVEWRGPAACARGRLRPDGYGVVRVGVQLHGFLLEFDRGTMRSGQLRAKFVAYHRYMASLHAARAFDGFPTILVVTTSPGSERRLATALCAADRGETVPLSALLTTTSWLEASPLGPFGHVWRTGISASRRAWPNGGQQ